DAAFRKFRCHDRGRRICRALHAAPAAQDGFLGAGSRGRQRGGRHLVLESLNGSVPGAIVSTRRGTPHPTSTSVLAPSLPRPLTSGIIPVRFRHTGRHTGQEGIMGRRGPGQLSPLAVKRLAKVVGRHWDGGGLALQTTQNKKTGNLRASWVFYWQRN